MQKRRHNIRKRKVEKHKRTVRLLGLFFMCFFIHLWDFLSYMLFTGAKDYGETGYVEAGFMRMARL